MERFIEQTITSTTACHLSEHQIRTALKGLERSIIDIQGTQTALYAATTPDQSILLQSLNLKKPCSEQLNPLKHLKTLMFQGFAQYQLSKLGKIYKAFHVSRNHHAQLVTASSR